MQKLTQHCLPCRKDKHRLNTSNNELLPHWLVVAAIFMTLLAYVIICHLLGHELQQPLPEERRVLLRTIFYAIAIITFPVTNLIRHVQLRLNQTMPGAKPARSRYLLTVIVSMLLVEGIGVLGFVMFMLGDDYNTLYIFIGLSVLGVYLYRPKLEEYGQVVEALADRKDSLG